MNLIRMFREYKLKTQLKAVFDRAESLDEKGVAYGPSYAGLYADAMSIIEPFKAKYPDYDVGAKIGALNKLREMSASTPKKYNAKLLAYAFGIFILVMQVFGVIAAAYTSSYHFWLHVFQYMGLRY